MGGVERDMIQVFGEELQDVAVPAEAAYPAKPGKVDGRDLDVSSAAAVRSARCRLGGVGDGSPIAEGARR